MLYSIFARGSALFNTHGQINLTRKGVMIEEKTN